VSEPESLEAATNVVDLQSRYAREMRRVGQDLYEQGSLRRRFREQIRCIRGEPRGTRDPLLPPGPLPSPIAIAPLVKASTNPALLIGRFIGQNGAMVFVLIYFLIKLIRLLGS